MTESDAQYLEIALLLASQAHRGQRRRDGSPYILHPLRVMLRLEDPSARIVALLHDVVEDSPVTLDDLRREGLPEAIVEAVGVLTKVPGMDYTQDYLPRVKANALARAVKLADLADNSQLHEMPELSERDLQRLAKYHQARRFLEA